MEKYILDVRVNCIHSKTIEIEIKHKCNECWRNNDYYLKSDDPATWEHGMVLYHKTADNTFLPILPS